MCVYVISKTALFEFYSMNINSTLKLGPRNQSFYTNCTVHSGSNFGDSLSMSFLQGICYPKYLSRNIYFIYKYFISKCEIFPFLFPTHSREKANLITPAYRFWDSMQDTHILCVGEITKFPFVFMKREHKLNREPGYLYILLFVVVVLLSFVLNHI